MKTHAAHPMKIITLCVMMLFTATLVTFSQTSQNGQQYGVMHTPDHEQAFNLTNPVGQTITALVVGFNDKAIAIRVGGNAAVTYIPWENLNESTIEALRNASIVKRSSPAGTIPYKTTITDKQGRSIKGTILHKSETAITFQREGERTNFQVQTATLSEENQEMIAGLLQTAPMTNKPTVLLHHDYGYSSYIAGLVFLLQKNGFHVTIGLTNTEMPGVGKEMNPRRTRYEIPEEINTIIIHPLSVSDHYDFLWTIRAINTDPTHVEGIRPDVNNKELLAYKYQTNGRVIQRAFRSDAKKHLWKTGDPPRGKRRTDFSNYAVTDDNWIFYLGGVPEPGNPEKYSTRLRHEEIIEIMKRMLPK